MPLAIHADLDAVVLQHLSEGLAGELAALVSVNDLRPPVAADCFAQRIETERRIHADRHTMG